MSKRPVLEVEIQRQSLAAIGAEPDVIVLVNSVGVATHYDKEGKSWKVPYGLGVGSPDVVAILAPRGRWLCLEYKVPGEEPRPEQLTCHEQWRAFGALVFTVHSVDETWAALRVARELSK